MAIDTEDGNRVAQQGEIPVIDVADPVNANWRDILREDPNDPRFRRPPGCPDFLITPVPGAPPGIYRISVVRVDETEG